MAGSAPIWLVRCPGGPTKIVRSKNNKPLTEAKVKEAYMQSFAHKYSKGAADKEATWPVLKPVDDAEIAKDHSQLLQKSEVTGTRNRVVEV